MEIEKKRVRQEWVSEDFSNYLNKIQREIEDNTGRTISKADLTHVFASIRPNINVPKELIRRKEETIFDF